MYPNFLQKEFKTVSRMERNTFDSIVENLDGLQKGDTNWREAIPVDKKVAIALYTLGSS